MNLDPLHKLWQSFAKHPEGQWILGYEDAERIYKIIQKYKPKKVLDLGGGIGCSAAVIALALQDAGLKPANVTGDAEIDSVEQSLKCLSLAEQLLPADLKEYINFHHAPAFAKQFPEIVYQWFSVFNGLPMDDYDFVVMDGPGPWTERNQMVKLPNGDFISLLQCLKKDTLIYLDGRRDAERIIFRFFADYLEPVARQEDWTLFRRTEKPYEGKVEDAMGKEIKEVTGYDL